MFSLLDVVEGDKMDFWLLTSDPFDVSRFARRRKEHALGLELLVSSPEDTILAKLRWAKLSGGSQKHAQDALRVYEVQQHLLDHGYLDRWADTLGVSGSWRQLKQDAVDE